MSKAGLQHELFEASSDGQAAAIRRLLRAGADIDGRSDEDQTALMIASRGTTLSELEAWMESPDDWDGIPFGQPKAVGALLAAGADAALADHEGRTALHYTAVVGAEACAKLLLAAGAPHGVRDNNGETPLVIARANGHYDLAKLLERQPKATAKAKAKARTKATAKTKPKTKSTARSAHKTMGSTANVAPARPKPTSAPRAYAQQHAVKLGKSGLVVGADILAVGFTPDGERVCIADRCHLWMVGANDGRLLAKGTFDDGEEPMWNIASAMSGGYVATWYGHGSRVTLWKIDGPIAKGSRPRLPFKNLYGFFFLDQTQGVAHCGDGNGRGACAILDLASGKVVSEIPVKNLRHALPLPGGRILTIPFAGPIAAVDIATRKVVWKHPLELERRAVSLSADRKRLYVSEEDDEVAFLAMIDLASGRVIRKVDATRECPVAVDVSQAGDVVLVRARAGDSVLWTADLKKKLGALDADLLVPTGNAIVTSDSIRGGRIVDRMHPERVLATVKNAAKSNRVAFAGSHTGKVAFAFDKGGWTRLELWQAKR